MNIIKNMDIDSSILYADNYFSCDYNHIIYLKRVPVDSNNKPKFYLNIYTVVDGKLLKQGYLYFYIDFEAKISSFIGVGIKPVFRNMNIGSFLIASWIDLCLNNNIYYLDANEKQKKPFLLYLLKTYGFDVFDKSLYDTRTDVISICKSVDVCDKRKFLMFKDNKYEKLFINTPIFKTDNYEIIHNLENFDELDKVILPIQETKRNWIKYSMLDRNLAEDKCKLVLSRHRK